MWSTWPTSSQSDAAVPSVAGNTVREVGPVLVQRGALHLVVVRAMAQCGGRRDARGECADGVNGKAATFEAEPAIAYPGHCGHAKRFGFRCSLWPNGKQYGMSELRSFEPSHIAPRPCSPDQSSSGFHHNDVYPILTFTFVCGGTIRGVVVPTFEQRHAL